MFNQTLLSLNDVYADVINCLFFEGEERVLPNDLQDFSILSYCHNPALINRTVMEHEITKFWTKGEVIFILKVKKNNQTVQELSFNVYDRVASTYYLQKHRHQNIIYPVIPFVLYFDVEHIWDKETSIKKQLEIPEDLEPFVNDFQVPVFDVAGLSMEQVETFKSDFYFVADSFSKTRHTPGYVPVHNREMKHFDKVTDFILSFAK